MVEVEMAPSGRSGVVAKLGTGTGESGQSDTLENPGLFSELQLPHWGLIAELGVPVRELSPFSNIILSLYLNLFISLSLFLYLSLSPIFLSLSLFLPSSFLISLLLSHPFSPPSLFFFLPLSLPLVSPLLLCKKFQNRLREIVWQGRCFSLSGTAAPTSLTA